MRERSWGRTFMSTCLKLVYSLFLCMGFLGRLEDVLKCNAWVMAHWKLVYMVFIVFLKTTSEQTLCWQCAALMSFKWPWSCSKDKLYLLACMRAQGMDTSTVNGDAMIPVCVGKVSYFDFTNKQAKLRLAAPKSIPYYAFTTDCYTILQ